MLRVSLIIKLRLMYSFCELFNIFNLYFFLFLVRTKTYLVLIYYKNIFIRLFCSLIINTFPYSNIKIRRQITFSIQTSNDSQTVSQSSFSAKSLQTVVITKITLSQSSFTVKKVLKQLIIYLGFKRNIFFSLQQENG